MTAWQTTWEVARWEFRRFLKPKQLLVSVITMLITGAIGFGVTRVIRRADVKTVSIAVIGGEQLGLSADTVGARLVFQAHTPANEAMLRDALGRGDVDGVLLVRDSARAELLARRDPPWRLELEQALTSAALQRRLAASGLQPGALQALLAPVKLDVTRPTGAGPGRGERILTGIVLLLSLIGLMTGMGFIFAGITGEKQQRVTEQVVSAISPQQWIDGKILGLAGVAMVNMLATAIAFGALFVVFAMSTGRANLSVAFDHPLLVPLLVLLPLLGFLMWFTFLSAVAATIDDPHTSTKGSLLMLPMLPIAIAGLLFTRADTSVAQVFALIPFTAPAVLPLRLLLADVAVWEVTVALVLLSGTIWLLRKAAGKIFAVGMLMYGKEPNLREMWRWARSAG